MYDFRERIFEKKRSVKYLIFQEDKPLPYGDFIELLQKEKEFRAFFINLLSDIPFRAYHWETPPVTRDTVDKPFEFVVSNTPGIDLPPEPGPFRSYLGGLPSASDIAVFNNLGGDARLVAPAPMGEGMNYSHIGVFTEEAPEHQQQELWQKVGREVERHIADEPLWLNTAGGGVAWLHVRLDSHPKYYRHQPYRKSNH